MKKPTHRKPNRPHNVRRQGRARRDGGGQAVQAQGDGYVDRLRAAVSAGGIVRPGEVSIGTVTHQPGCLRPYGGHCTCQPDIECVDASGRVHVIGLAGEVTSTTRVN